MPKIPLIIIHLIIIIKFKKKKLFEYIKIIIGAIFCHVSIIKVFNQVKPSIISGNQKWNGAAPIFNKSAEFNIKFIENFISILYIKLIESLIIENNNIVDAKAWIMKYFNLASAANILLDLFIKGIIESKLISNPIHILIQLYEEIVINVPENNEIKNNNLYKNIKKKRIKTYINGVWTQ